MGANDLAKYLVIILILAFNSFIFDISSGVNAISQPLNSSDPEYQRQNYSIDSLFIALFSNGDATVDYNLVIDSNRPTQNITLFGQTIQNLTLADYNGTSIQYSPTDKPNEIAVGSQSSSNIHVTYTTPDFVDKQNRNWTFSLLFEDKFLLKLPDDAHIITMEPQPFLTPTYERDLWGFGPGQVEVEYIIGPLGTKEDAQASIRFMESAVEETKTNYKDLVLNNVTNFIDRTKSLFNEGKYLDAINLATKTSELLQNITDSYLLGQHSISDAKIELQNKKGEGYDISKSEELLANAESLFSGGQYKNAIDAANLAVSQTNLQQNPSVSYFSIGIITAVILLVIIILFLRKRSRLSNAALKNNFQQEIKNIDNNVTFNDSITQNSSQEPSLKSKPANLSATPINILHSPAPEENEIRDYVNKVVREVNNVRTGSLEEKVNRDGISSSPSTASMDKVQLVQLVAQMKLKKPYLRSEEKELLDFLIEKDGTAFESEVRTKFVLPRTSLWRLIKRLEREELLEVVKIGGQNLIKLRFEYLSD